MQIKGLKKNLDGFQSKQCLKIPIIPTMAKYQSSPSKKWKQPVSK